MRNQQRRLGCYYSRNLTFDISSQLMSGQMLAAIRFSLFIPLTLPDAEPRPCTEREQKPFYTRVKI